MKDLYLVDGYNVIFWLPKVFDREDLESSRKKLIDLLEDYGAHNNLEMIVVFDGQGSSNKARIEKMGKNFTIVFTPSRMTADSYIEKESYDRREEYRSIYVVTSDGPEQSQVLGNGAYRVAVDDLIRAVNEDKKVQTTFISHHNNQNLRSEIGRRYTHYVDRCLPIRLLHERAREDQTTISSPPGTYRAAFHFAAAQVRKGLRVQRVLHFREHPARLAEISDLLNFFMDKRG